MPALNLALPCAQTTPAAPKTAVSSPDKTQQGAEEGAQPQGFAEQLDARVKDNQSKDAPQETKAQSQPPSDQAKPSDPAESTDASAAAAAALAALLGNPAQTATPVTGASAQTAPAAMTAEASSDGAQTAALQAITAGTIPNAAALAAATAKPAMPATSQPAATSGEDKGSDTRSTPQLGQPVAREALTAAATPLTQDATELGAKPQGSRAGDQATGELSSQQTSQAQNFAEQLNARTAHLARSEAPQITVHTQAAQPGWAEEVGNRISWMASKDMGKAELVLTPAHLGRVEISLSVDGDQASAAFVAATPAAREALEQSIPRLREVLSQSGLNLGQVNVSANNANSQGRQENRGGDSRSRASGSSAVGGVSAGVMTSRIRQANGLVDTFA